MTQRNRDFARLLAVVVCLVVLLSAFYIAAEADHDCIGEHCLICCHVAVCKTVLETLGAAVFVARIVAALTRSLDIVRSAPVRCATKDSLISLKVKLSD